eukprot:CAMPEP_0194068626 /NCGR_PEP_ID=MMETSP0009_2-20130614/87195_1 /TAXON_ID=210454 /ORGANISM="Grammatophora oceanica, Strain CCMP 410" /LENGTH=178 /DNA_ID=CAMNT_0038721741 /DNA_START=472 /DNA_END=1008 /DNA_ORIENTATION=-
MSDKNPDKRGHSCFGCCCDMRRAVIIVGILNIVFSVISLVILLFTVQVVKNADDDSVQDVVDEVDKAATSGIVMVVVGIVCSILAIVGAVIYNKWLVLVNIIYLIASYVAAVVINLQAASATEGNENEFNYGPLNIMVGVFFLALWIYPHAFFVKEVMDGTMDKETYKSNEEQSCCCV